jgi:hypothetical protein
MTFATYDELKSAIAEWLARPDDATLAPFVGAFVTLVEARLNRRLRVRAMEVTTTLTLAGALTALPTDFLELKGVRLAGGERAILPYAPAMVLDAVEQRTPSGRPRLHTLSGESLRVAPAPDGPYDAALTYFRKLPALSPSQPSNWLLAAAPDVYLYGSLLEAAPFLMSDERLPVWSAAFEAALRSLVDADAAGRSGGAALAAQAG